MFSEDVLETLGVNGDDSAVELRRAPVTPVRGLGAFPARVASYDLVVTTADVDDLPRDVIRVGRRSSHLV